MDNYPVEETSVFGRSQSDRWQSLAESRLR